MFQWVLNKHLSSESGNKNTSWLVSNGEIYRAVNKKLPVVKRTTSNARLWTQAPFKAYLRFFLLVNCSLWCCDYYYLSCLVICTAQKMKLSVKEFFSKYEQILRKLRIWSHLLKKSLLENFIFVQCWLILQHKTITILRDIYRKIVWTHSDNNNKTKKLKSRRFATSYCHNGLSYPLPPTHFKNGLACRKAFVNLTQFLYCRLVL